MDARTFVRLSRRLGQRTDRRGAVLGGAGALAGLAAALKAPPKITLAAPAPPPRPVDLERWPGCSSERSDYCLAEFSVGVVDMLGPDRAPFELHVYTLQYQDPSEAVGVQWALYGSHGQDLTPLGLDEDIAIRLRTGRLQAGSSYGWAVDLRVETRGDAEAGWETVITGRPAIQPIINGEDNIDDIDWEQADGEWRVFSGSSYDPSSVYGSGGDYSCAEARSMGPPSWRDGGWNVQISSPTSPPTGA